MHRLGDLTYYEGLGVSNSASPEEIRDAFRALVRLLHPDRQTDAQLKNSAEIQMRKINRIYSVLSDPERRRRYDYSLEAPSPPTIVFGPDSGPKLQRLMSRFAWMGAVLVIVVMLIWLAQDGPPSGPFPVNDRVNAQKPLVNTSAGNSDLPSEFAQLRSELSAATAERDAAIHELTRLRVRTIRPSGATALSALPGPVGHFAGTWFYKRVSDIGRDPSAVYPPEFIEATLNEDDGVIHGRYRSRYQIVDRAISPDVNFEFTGTAGGSHIVCPWRGPGGSKGELTMKLTGENALEIEWSTTELGTIQGLVSGTARLIRRVE
ncbi:MAG: J domain-containing protein [Terriglobia bacterium]